MVKPLAPAGLDRVVDWRMPSAHAVPGFLPSTHGLRFANTFPPGPTLTLGPIDPRWIGIGDAAAGLCGGMSAFVRERFESGLPISPDPSPPPNGSPLFRALVRRQVESLDWLRTPFRFWWAGASGAERARRRSRVGEWPRIRADVDAGHPSMVGLVRHTGLNPFSMTQSHQVLAYAYESEGEAITLRIYDPNWPGRDDVAIEVGANGVRQTTGEILVGILRLA